MSLSFSSRSSSMMEKKQTTSSSELFLDRLFKSGDDNKFSTTIVQNSLSPIYSANIDNNDNNTIMMDPNNKCSFFTSSPMMDIDNNDNDTIMMDATDECSLISTSSAMMDINNNDNDTIIIDPFTSLKKKKMSIKMEKKSNKRLKLKNMKKKVMKIMKKSSVRFQQLKENEKMPKEKMMAVKFTVHSFSLKGLKALKRVTIKQKNQVKKRKSLQPVSSKTIPISDGKRSKRRKVQQEGSATTAVAVGNTTPAVDVAATPSTLVGDTTAATSISTSTSNATTPCVVATTAALVANEENSYDKKSDEDKISTSTSSTVSLSSMSSSSNNDSDSSLSHNKDDDQPATTVTALTPLTLQLPTTPKSVKTMINFDWGFKDAINNDDGLFLQVLWKDQQCNEEFGCNEFDCVRCR